MAEPFLSEIRIMSFNFPPKGWAVCDGQFLPINQNQALFSLLGTTFGGNGQTNFALPDLRERTPIHVGSGHTLGESGGAQVHTISIAELPEHAHLVSASSTDADTATPTAATVIARSEVTQPYRDVTNLVAMSPAAITSRGGSLAHENRQPFLALTFCIALQGSFPTLT